MTDKQRRNYKLGNAVRAFILHDRKAATRARRWKARIESAGEELPVMQFRGKRFRLQDY